MSPTRAEAEALLFEFTKSDALRKHARAVEEVMRAYAGWYGITDPAEVEKWGMVGLLHDFDYEQNPTEDRHLHVGGRILRERGWPEESVEAIRSHAASMKSPRDTPLNKPLYAAAQRPASASSSIPTGTRPWTTPTSGRSWRRWERGWRWWRSSRADRAAAPGASAPSRSTTCARWWRRRPNAGPTAGPWSWPVMAWE